MRSLPLAAMLGFAFTIAAASCASGGGGGYADNGTTDARTDTRRNDARDVGLGDDTGVDEDAAIPDASKLDAKADVTTPVDSSVDAKEGGLPTGQCFDVGLGAARAIVKPTAGQLVISEWMPDPTAVTDANGEWFELKTNAAFDLNGVQVGTTSLGTPLAPANCVPVASGQFVLFAKNSNGTSNGLGVITVDHVTSLNLVNSNGTLQVGVDGAALHTVTWTTTTAGKSIMIDTNGTQCIAPAAVTAYNGTDFGTPRAANTALCP